MVVLVAFHYRRNKSGLIERTDYIYETNAKVYFFKNIDYIELNNFSAEDLVNVQGSKVNGYSALTKSKKIVDQTYIKNQIKTIDRILSEKAYKDWPTIVGQLQSNFRGLDKIFSQMGKDQKERKIFLVNSASYMGMTKSELIAKKKTFEALQNTGKRDIILGKLDMLSTGYIYGTVNTMEKVVRESTLPYVDVSFLNDVSKIDQQSESVLKIVDNDRLFAAFIVDRDELIGGESQALAMKKKIVGTKGKKQNAQYYNYLVKRVDVLWQYPQLTIEKNGKNYDCYLVDVMYDGNQKIAVVLFKDYISVFAGDNTLKTDIHLQAYTAYEVPQSAIIKKSGQTYLKILKKNYFTSLQKVKVDKYEKGKAIMRVVENPDLAVGTAYKIYP